MSCPKSRRKYLKENLPFHLQTYRYNEFLILTKYSIRPYSLPLPDHDTHPWFFIRAAKWLVLLPGAAHASITWEPGGGASSMAGRQLAWQGKAQWLGEQETTGWSLPCVFSLFHPASPPCLVGWGDQLGIVGVHADLFGQETQAALATRNPEENTSLWGPLGPQGCQGIRTIHSTFSKFFHARYQARHFYMLLHFNCYLCNKCLRLLWRNKQGDKTETAVKITSSQARLWFQDSTSAVYQPVVGAWASAFISDCLHFWKMVAMRTKRVNTCKILRTIYGTNQAFNKC